MSVCFDKKEIGRRLICERCGYKIFLPYLGDKDFDGGFTVVSCFQDPPEGWDSFYNPVTGHSKNLCPKCMKELGKILDLYMRKVERADGKDDG